MDEHAWIEHGLYDPDAPNAEDRLALLRYLTSEGCTLAEMVVAHECGRLFGLAGDRQIEGPITHTIRQAAEHVGLDPELLRGLWRAFGFADPGLDVPVMSAEHLDMLPLFVTARQIFGDQGTLSLSRVMGASMARVAEAEAAALRVNMEELNIDYSANELVTAQAYRGTVALVPQVAAVLDVLHRRHIKITQQHFEAVIDTADPVRNTARQVVGFADLSGFTARSQVLSESELGGFMTSFEHRAAEVLTDVGGRIVKFIGDAAMFVVTTPTAAAYAGLQLVEEFADAELPVKVGLAFGQMIAQDGDYYGPPVNLASRLTALARPGSVVVTRELRQALPEGEFRTHRMRPQKVRGYAEPVTAYRLRRLSAVDEEAG